MKVKETKLVQQTDSEKKVYVKVSIEDESGWYTMEKRDLLGAIQAELDSILSTKAGWPSESLTIRLETVEMTQVEYDKLPEFMGW